MLEFAIGSTIMMSLFAGTFEFGLTFFRYNLLLNSVRNATQFGSLRSYNSRNSTPSSAYLTAVKNMAVYGSPEGGTTPVVPGLTTDNIDVVVTFQNQIPSSVSVTVNSYSLNTVFSVRSFTGKPTMTFPYLGRFAPSTI